MSNFIGSSPVRSIDRAIDRPQLASRSDSLPRALSGSLSRTIRSLSCFLSIILDQPYLCTLSLYSFLVLASLLPFFSFNPFLCYSFAHFTFIHCQPLYYSLFFLSEFCLSRNQPHAILVIFECQSIRESIERAFVHKFSHLCSRVSVRYLYNVRYSSYRENCALTAFVSV